MTGSNQPLFLVFGGELKHVGSTEFTDPAKLHFVGVFADHDAAHRAWSAVARATIDDAQTRYFLVDLRRALAAQESPLGTGKGTEG